MSRSVGIIDMFEMSNLRKPETGLPMIVWVSSEGSGTRKNKKGKVRIKFQKDTVDQADIYNTVSISVEDEPKVLSGTGLPSKDMSLVQGFIKMNRKVLEAYWYGVIGTMDMMSSIKPVVTTKKRRKRK